MTKLVSAGFSTDFLFSPPPQRARTQIASSAFQPLARRGGGRHGVVAERAEAEEPLGTDVNDEQRKEGGGGQVTLQQKGGQNTKEKLCGWEAVYRPAVATRVAVRLSPWVLSIPVGGGAGTAALEGVVVPAGAAASSSSPSSSSAMARG